MGASSMRCIWVVWGGNSICDPRPHRINRGAARAAHSCYDLGVCAGVDSSSQRKSFLRPTAMGVGS